VGFSAATLVLALPFLAILAFGLYACLRAAF
jgi:hypothetical protein